MNTCPIFRLAISLAAGIFFAETFRIDMGIYPEIILLLLLVILGRLLKQASYAGRWIFGIGVSFFMFGLGIILTEHAWKSVIVEWPKEKRVYQGMLLEVPQERSRAFQCRVIIAEKEVLLYLPKDSLSSTLKVGDGILAVARIDKPRNRKEGQYFDYERYLYHKWISGVAYASAWEKCEAKQQKNLKLKALSFREWLIEKYRCWGIEDKQIPVLSALTLGYKGDLDKETRQIYSVAGISHVLALSGMHIGIIWVLLEVLLRFLRRGHLKVLKWGIVTLILWTFAFVVGLEASVVRAVVMCMLMGLGSLAGSKPLSMNTLSITAFFMLLYYPFYLFDVGFQLSFVAVASILTFYPMIYSSIIVRSRVLRWIWGTVSVTIAAQVGTAPLVMYYFSSFSVYFILTNLVVALLVPLIIYMSILMILFFPLPCFQVLIVRSLNGLVSALNGVAEWTSGLPFASLSLSVLTVFEVAFSYLFLILVYVYWKTKQRKWLIRCLISCACLLSLHLYTLCCG